MKEYEKYLKEILEGEDQRLKAQAESIREKYDLKAQAAQAETDGEIRRVNEEAEDAIDRANVQKLIDLKNISQRLEALGLSDSGLKDTSVRAAMRQGERKIQGADNERTLKVENLHRLLNERKQKLENEKSQKVMALKGTKKSEEASRVRAWEKLVERLYDEDMPEIKRQVYLDNYEKLYGFTHEERDLIAKILPEKVEGGGEPVKNGISEERKAQLEKMMDGIYSKGEYAMMTRGEADMPEYNEYLESVFNKWVRENKISSLERELLQESLNKSGKDEK